MHLFIFFAIALTACCNILLGSDECLFTPIVNIYKDSPSSFNSNSNLLLQSHEGNYSLEGEAIILEGHVLDMECNPITDAFVGIWQVNSNGIDNRDINRDFFESDPKTSIKKIDNRFAGNGSAITDNLGLYRFLTVIPGKVDGMSPNINFYLEHDDFLPFSTMAFFDNIKDIKTNNRFVSNMSNSLKKLLLVKKTNRSVFFKELNKAVPVYEFNITLSGNSAFKKSR